MANVLGSLVVQDLTYTQRVHGQNFRVTYENGGIAGAERVRVDGLEIIVKIASGTSTATQIRTAVLACVPAAAIVNVTISGTGSNAQMSAVRAQLSGGALAMAAALPLYNGLRLEAITPGTAGNSIQVRFVDTGTFSIALVGTDITINVDDTVTTYKEVMDGLRGGQNLVYVQSPNDLEETAVDIVAHMLPTSLTALSGGTASSNQAVVIQDLTYTSTTLGPSSKRQYISYTHGATAGAEVVSLDTNGNETIQIQNGVSTATQIKAAHDASAPALALRTVAITGTGSNAQDTVNMEGDTGLSSEATESTKDYYSDQSLTALTTSYVPQYFGFHADSIIIYNDETSGSDYLEWSLNGTETGGRLKPGESVVMDHLGNGRAVISLRSNPAGVDYRLEASGV